MNMLEAALALAARGFYVFPLAGDKGTPRWPGWPEKASRDEAKIRQWWTNSVTGKIKHDWVAIVGGKFDRPDNDWETVHLLVMDVDLRKAKGDKPARNGYPTLLDLELTHNLSLTYSQATPSGGRHLVFWSATPCKNSVNRWPGIDTRGRGGYFVGAGSPGYTVFIDTLVAEAPAALTVEVTSRPVAVNALPDGPPAEDAVMVRAIEWLRITDAAIEGTGGDDRTYQVCCSLKDMSVPAHMATFALISSGWNDRCDPPWELADLDKKVQNAYLYSYRQPGYADPIASGDFTAVTIAPPGPERETIDSINTKFAWVALGATGTILWETRDSKGQPVVRHLAPQAFHGHMAPRRPKRISHAWMTHSRRRSYSGLVFAPGKAVDPQWYNLWMGFTVQPAARHEVPTAEAAWALKAFEELTAVIICDGVTDVHTWLKGWLASMIQRPWEKARVAVALRGSKGIGKSFFAKTIGWLLGEQFLSVSDDRYLNSNFNAHLENRLLLSMEETSWPGDPKSESILKDMITREHHVIERKYHEAYVVESYLRVIILGNAEWQVPASWDERRFAVFEVSNTRRNDESFFGRIEKGMLQFGGLRFLLRDLLDFSTSGVKTQAPATKGLLKQKTESLGVFQQWWLDSLQAGSLVGFGFGDAGDHDWPEDVTLANLRLAFGRYCGQRNIRTRLPADVAVARMLQQVCPNVKSVLKAAVRNGTKKSFWRLPGLSESRDLWDVFMGGKREWE